LAPETPWRSRYRDACSGYVVKQKDGRRNRYQIQAPLPLTETTS